MKRRNQFGPTFSWKNLDLLTNFTVRATQMKSYKLYLTPCHFKFRNGESSSSNGVNMAIVNKTKT